MSVACLISDMIRAGVDPDLVGRTAELLSMREPVQIIDAQAERRRERDRERKALRNSAESAESEIKEKEKRTKKEKETPISKENPPTGVKRKVFPPVEKPPDVGEEVWKDFLTHRKAKKSPVSQTVLDGIRLEAGKAGWVFEDALRETITRGWQSFKAEWVNKHEGTERNYRNGTAGYSNGSAAGASVDDQAERLKRRYAGKTEIKSPEGQPGTDSPGDRYTPPMLENPETLRIERK